MEAHGQAAFAEAMNQLWIRFLPQMEERLAVLESANRAFAEDALPDELRGDAAAAAHKLAGVLGTFGLEKGTELAREAEILYSGTPTASPETKQRLASITTQLVEQIRTRRT